MNGRSLELFFVDGRPEGMLTAEVFNWTGHVLRIPRTRLIEGLKRPHASQTGVYLLLGQNEKGPLAYIGEAEDMSYRVKQHATSKQWWEQAVLITTTGDALHKAHVKYLESRLAETALEAGNTPLENGNAPARSSLNEAATANMESFLETLHMVLPAIRIDIFQTGRRTKSAQDEKVKQTENPPCFELKIPKHNVFATAELIADEMIIKQGSLIRAAWIGDKKYLHNYQRQHQDILDKELVEILPNGTAKMVEDYAFSSPSAAASVASGRAANGRIAWKLPNGQTYAGWEAEQLESDK